MLACASCGEACPTRAQFCPGCGAALPAWGEGLAEERKVVTVLFCDMVGSTARAFYRSVSGAEVVRARDPVILALANTRIVLNVGGGPIDDKPTVRLAPPGDPDVSSWFLNLRVRDIAQAYRAWPARGAAFLTEPKDHGCEIRAYLRDPDGHLIEAGQTT